MSMVVIGSFRISTSSYIAPQYSLLSSVLLMSLSVSDLMDIEPTWLSVSSCSVLDDLVNYMLGDVLQRIFLFGCLCWSVKSFLVLVLSWCCFELVLIGSVMVEMAHF